MLPCLATEVKESCAEVGAHAQCRPFDVIPSADIGLMHAGAGEKTINFIIIIIIL